MDELDYTREEALDRQRLLHHNRCKSCPYRNSYQYTDQCENCPVKDELLTIGQVLDATLPRYKTGGVEMKKDTKKCCVCGATKNLYSVTPEKEENGKYVVEIYCEKHLPN